MKIKSEKAKVKVTAAITENIDLSIRETLEECGYTVNGMKFNKSNDGKQVSFSIDISMADENSWTLVSKKFYDNSSIYKAEIEY